MDKSRISLYYIFNIPARKNIVTHFVIFVGDRSGIAVATALLLFCLETGRLLTPGFISLLLLIN
jgi:hypothetical protein